MELNPYEASAVVESGEPIAFRRKLIATCCFGMMLLVGYVMAGMLHQQWLETGSMQPVGTKSWANLGVCLANFLAQLGMGAGVLRNNNRLTLTAFAVIPASFVLLFAFV